MTQARQALIEKIYAGDNHACFIERDTIHKRIRGQLETLPVEERYLFELTALLNGLSTPIEPEDVFAGRMVEGPVPDGWEFAGCFSQGHITLAMPKILAIGLDGIVEEIAGNARRVDTEEARYFERQTRGCVEAIRDYCRRYAEAAEACGKHEMAQALRIVPNGPAYDFHSALQSVWMVHFIFSTVIGARDFAPGRADQYLLPYYRQENNPERARELLSHFLLKFNEITGTATDNYARKPIPCCASKQYFTLGGRDAGGNWQFNELSRLFVEAAECLHLPQPTFNFRMGTDMPEDAWRLVGEAASRLDAQSNFFNDELTVNRLLNAGIRAEDAYGYDFTACNRVDLPGRLYNIMTRIDRFDNSFAWFRQALFAAAESREAVPAILHELGRIAEEAITEDLRNAQMDIYDVNHYRFSLESIFLDRCVQTCTDILRGGGELYRWNHRMFSGIANMADSLVAVSRLVDREKRYTLTELRKILDEDFAGHEELLAELRTRMPKYGNGLAEADDLAEKAANVLIDAAEKAARKEGFMMMVSFYSLTQHARFGQSIGATPDGRRCGETISENQSPAHGMDTSGPTALLASVARLPFRRCICGGLNMRFGSRQSPDTLAALLKTYFTMGGQHIGFTMADRKTLEDARRHPEQYRSLFVRKTGFSEFYVALSPGEQQEIIDRTEY